MDSLHLTPAIIAVALSTYLCAGVFKGLSGLGVQAVGVPVLALVAPLETAIGLGLLPAFTSSIWQGLWGGHLETVVRRTWTFLLPCCVTVFFGAALLASIDGSRLSFALGVLLCLYAIYAITRPTLPSPGRHELWLSPVLGAITGVVGGAAGVLVMPGAPYFQLLRLSRDELVQALSLSAVVVMPAIALALSQNSLLPAPVQIASLALLAPTFLGLWLGTKIRRWISEAAFRRVFFWLLLGLGVAIAARNWPG